MTARPTLRFVHLAGKQNQGSTVMRMHQLSRMLEPHLSDRYNIELSELPAGRLPWVQTRWAARQTGAAVYFFSKAALRVLKPATLERLRPGALGICFDHVDSDFRNTAHLRADIHLCTAYAQRDAIRDHQRLHLEFTGTPMVLLHNPDIRLTGFQPIPQDRARPLYLGTPSVGFLPDAVRARLDVIELMSADALDALLPRIASYNLHYCVRLPQPSGSRLIKPFTKGFTAAACRANVLVNRGTEDALEFLGEDYPYLVSALDEAEIQAALNERCAISAGRTGNERRQSWPAWPTECRLWHWRRRLKT